MVAEHLRRPVPGGIGTYVRGLVRGLEAVRQHMGEPDVTLLASRAPAAPDPLIALGRPVRTVPLPGRLLTRAWGWGLMRAPDGFDVVHAPSLAAPPTAAPLTVAVHDLAWRRLPGTFPHRGRRWHEAALDRAFRRALVLLVGTVEDAHSLVAAGARPGQVEVLDPMYGCDHLPPADSAAAGAVLARLGVEGPYLLTVSTIEPRKNLVRLVQAYGRARAELPEPWPLVVVGPHGWGPRLEPAPGLVLVGQVDEPVLAGLYARARCLAYVPLAEGFGLPAVEAMAAAVPVVASPMPSTAGAALEVDPLDVDGMAEALVRGAADDRVRSELVAAGLLRVRDLTWESAARRHVEVWQKLR